MWIYLFAILIVFLFHNFYWKRRNLPPGPTPLPFVGNMLEIVRNPPGYDAFIKWHKQYNGLFTYWVSTTPVVAITDYKLIHETFIKDSESYADRKMFGKIHELLKGGEYGIIFVNGEYWKEQRRFGIHVLRNLGMGKNIIEQKILLQFDQLYNVLISQLGSNSKGIVQLDEELEVTISSIINQLLFGFAYSEISERSKFAELKNRLARQVKIAMSPLLVFSALYPFLRFIPPFKTTYDEFKNGFDYFLNYFQIQIDKHKKNLNSNLNFENEIEDFTDAYLREMMNGKTGFHEKQLLNILHDFWIAGQETTSNTIIFGILYSIHHPEKQKKIHSELDMKINSSRRIIMDDKHDLPYLQAFISETQRCINLLPMNIFRQTTKEVEICGYKLPKNTCIIPQISTVLYDEKIFPEPMVFKPERFLNNDGTYKKFEEFIPFSVGKRQCLGESLAKAELFLLIANLFNQFEIEPIDPENLPTMAKDMGSTVQPKRFKCIVKKRF